MKDYKKILEGVVNIINTTEKSDIGFANICTYIGENCPELKESEDERIRKALINIFEHRNQSFIDELTNYSGNIKREEVLSWLESIRPQNTWKPSDEQVNALKHFVRSVGESGYASPYDNNTKLLYSLLEQLKKLREE